MIGVSARGQKPLKAIAGARYGSGTVVAVLKIGGTTACERAKLKVSVKTTASCSVQTLSTQRDILSGPAAFLMHTVLQGVRTSGVENERG